MKHIVSVYCITYNHSSFIKKALDGFCSQKTSFPFVSVIIDDASTDRTGEVIKTYMLEHFDAQDSSVDKEGDSADYSFYFGRHKSNKNCYFAVYLLKYNHYQIRKTKWTYVNKWAKLSKYIAICEGDDYWVSPDKLQRQVFHLDKNPDYSMTCNKTLLYSQKKQQIVGENYCYHRNKKIPLKDVVFRTGLFISTCSIMFRKEITENIPDYWKDCMIGDLPLQIACALNGSVWYCNDAMSVYRIDNSSSWMGAQNWGSGTDSRIYRLIDSSIRMFDGFSSDYPKYKKLFKNKIAEEINRNVPSARVSYQELVAFLDYYSKEIKDYSLRWKIDLYFRKCRIPYLRIIYEHFFARYYQPKNKWYKD